MSYEGRDLDVKSTVSLGDIVEVDGLSDKWVQLKGSFTATIEILVSLDGGTTYLMIATLDAPNIVEVPQPATHMRTNTTAISSGAPTATLRAFNPALS